MQHADPRLVQLQIEETEEEEKRQQEDTRQRNDTDYKKLIGDGDTPPLAITRLFIPSRPEQEVHEDLQPCQGGLPAH